MQIFSDVSKSPNVVEYDKHLRYYKWSICVCFCMTIRWLTEAINSLKLLLKMTYFISTELRIPSQKIIVTLLIFISFYIQNFISEFVIFMFVLKEVHCCLIWLHNTICDVCLVFVFLDWNLTCYNIILFLKNIFFSTATKNLLKLQISIITFKYKTWLMWCAFVSKNIA